MKNCQFEEITFWLSLIACLLAYDAEILWLAKILEGISVINFFLRNRYGLDRCET